MAQGSLLLTYGVKKQKIFLAIIPLRGIIYLYLLFQMIKIDDVTGI